MAEQEQVAGHDDVGRGRCGRVVVAVMPRSWLEPGVGGELDEVAVPVGSGCRMPVAARRVILAFVAVRTGRSFWE